MKTAEDLKKNICITVASITGILLFAVCIAAYIGFLYVGIGENLIFCNRIISQSDMPAEKYDIPAEECNLSAGNALPEIVNLSLEDNSVYMITWNIDGMETTTEVEAGTYPCYYNQPYKMSDDQYDYEFSCWMPDITEATCDTTYTAQFNSTPRQYIVTWSINDMSYSEKFEYGSLPVCGYNTDRATECGIVYTFEGWMPEVSEVCGDAWYNAQYSEEFIKYKITWDDGNGEPITVETAYGEIPIYNEIVEKPTDAQYEYTFREWSPTPSSTTSDKTYTAVYDKRLRQYTVSWIVEGNIVHSDVYDYGSTPWYHIDEMSMPQSEQYNYSFSGWYPAVTSVTGDAEYTAQFSTTAREYMIMWALSDGAALHSEYVAYGSIPQYSGDMFKEPDEQYYYTFNGWFPEVGPVTGDATYFASYTENPQISHTIKWIVDGQEYTKEVLHDMWTEFHGSVAKEPEGLIEYTFTGWSPSIVRATENAVYTA